MDGLLVTSLNRVPNLQKRIKASSKPRMKPCNDIQQSYVKLALGYVINHSPQLQTISNICVWRSNESSQSWNQSAKEMGKTASGILARSLLNRLERGVLIERQLKSSSTNSWTRPICNRAFWPGILPFRSLCQILWLFAPENKILVLESQATY